ncbi:hypothetical protein [Halosimplex marinum]|uniref:hypothetical protein n=1 Tax=Halosimplex marinum TaxID=3396620 RepID=UPI003F54438E
MLNLPDEVSALDLLGQDEHHSDAGGELRVLKETFDDDRSEIIFKNAGKCIESLEELLIETADGPPAKQMLNSVCWQAIRDLKSSLFLAATGHYRQATILDRGIVENAGSALYFAQRIEDEGEQVWEEVSAWFDGEKKHSPSFDEIQAALTDVAPFLGRDIHVGLKSDREYQNQHVHSPVGGNVEHTIFDEKKQLMHTWSTTYQFGELKPWYIGFMRNISYLLVVVTELIRDDPVSRDPVDFILGRYKQAMDDFTVTDTDSEATVDISPRSTD